MSELSRQMLWFLLIAAAHAAVPLTMQAVRSHGACSPPFACVETKSVLTPRAKSGEALVRIAASSVNPSDVDMVEAGGCILGCGADIAGTVVQCDGCTRIKAGDEVWTVNAGAYAEYTAVAEAIVSLKPKTLNFTAAATIPEVGLTSLLSLKRTGSEPGTPLPAGSPWTSNFSPARMANLTVLITAGSGGTGFIGIELAVAYGAKHVATATSGAAGIAFVRSLGATFVTDYKKVDIFDALPPDSVDVVYGAFCLCVCCLMLSLTSCKVVRGSALRSACTTRGLSPCAVGALWR